MVYYNENNAKAAAWLRELIKARLIADGEVDERDIREVKPDELTQFKQCHFFAGIGGWSYALRLAGWPDDEPVWTGSCPCQPFSVAGKKQVDSDERHLWPAFRALIAERKPSVVFGEQVASADGRIWLAGVRADLEALGYAVGAADLCAAGVGAPMQSQRLHWVGQTNCARPQQGGPTTKTNGHRHSIDPASSNAMWVGPAYSTGHALGMGINGNDDTALGKATRKTTVKAGAWDRWDIAYFTDGKSRRFEPESFPLAHGVPERVVRLRGYGNAIVPQVAAEFVRAYVETKR